MAEVFKARLSGVQGFEKILVIKRILPHLARREDFLRMFINEAKLSARLHHQNVAQVYELGQLEDGEYFMAMEYVSGTDLRALLQRSLHARVPMPIWFALHAMSEVLSGLAYAHELTDHAGRSRAVVHRDVTPGNIFISHQGEVKIADFGIAKAAGLISETVAGQVKGNVSYLAPEVIYGDKVDARADLFACGVVLFEMLTRQRPFSGASRFEIAKKSCEADRAPPSLYNAEVPDALDAIVLSALSIDPDQRPQSARALQAQVLHLLGRMRPQRLPTEVREVVDSIHQGKAIPAKLFSSASQPARQVVKPARDRTSDTLELEPIAEPVPVVSLGEYLWADTFQKPGADSPFTPDRFILKTKVGEAHNADRYENLVELWSALANQPNKRPDRISHDGYRFISCRDFARLAGLEALYPDTRPLKQVRMLGSLEERNLVSVLASLAKIRATGKLVLMDTSAQRVSRREIHINQGAPVFVSSNSPSLLLPELLLRHRVIEREEMTSVFHDVIRTGTTIEDVVSRFKGIDVVSFWPAIMRQRMLELFRWRCGRFAFDAAADVRPVLPFESSLFDPLLHGVEYGVTADELWSWMQPYLHSKLERAPTFDRLCRKLSLRPEVTRAAQRLGKKDTISQVLRKHPQDAHRALCLAYICISSGELKYHD